ncbi:MAG: LuxR C-terminal-related transcriptional regulator [Bacteroides sp.]|jgi:DNA-binding CsgD family transcriptional regulator|nr:LuxR C-terminal-related transcriptional regulator [Bacteroides sp.]
MEKSKNTKKQVPLSVELEKDGVLKTNLDLKKKVLFYEKIFSEVNASILLFDLINLRAVWSNGNLTKVLGLKPKQVIAGEELIEHYHPEDQNMLLEMRDFFRDNKKGTFTGFYKFRNTTGEYIWFYTTAQLFRYNLKEGVFEVLAATLNFSDHLTYGKNLKIFAQEKLRDINSKQVNRITNREKQVVKYFSNGFRTREIADLLGISTHTVNNHRKNILRKLELKNLAALVNFAVENGLD